MERLVVPMYEGWSLHMKEEYVDLHRLSETNSCIDVIGDTSKGKKNHCLTYEMYMSCCI